MGELQGQSLVILILLGTAGMLFPIGCIAVFILLYQKRILQEKQKHVLQELAHQNVITKLQFASQEQERKRIGADLHDSLGSLLAGAKLNATFLHKSTELGEPASKAYQHLYQILDESIDVVRRISWELNTEAFQYSGLSSSVSKLCNRLTGKGVEIRFEETGARQWKDDRALHVFRIIQELVNNAIKHSGASVIIVSLIWSDEKLDVVVTDNGTGLKRGSESTGVGLWNIDHRIKQLNGRITMKNNEDGGLHVRLDIPISSWSELL